MICQELTNVFVCNFCFKRWKADSSDPNYLPARCAGCGNPRWNQERKFHRTNPSSTTQESANATTSHDAA